MYILSIENYLLPVPEATPTDLIDMDREKVYEINFWEDTHALLPGQPVTITSVIDAESRIGDKLEGVVSSVQQHKVWIKGRNVTTIID